MFFFIEGFRNMVTIAGQCRTNPWPAVRDWILMPKCQCWTVGADYRKKCQCWTNFSPVFWHLHMITPSAAVHIWTCRVYHFPIPAVWKCSGYPFKTTNDSSMNMQRVPPFLNARMSDCPASSQSGTGMNKNADAGTSLVPDWDTGCWNADADGIDLDADAQLWLILMAHWCPMRH